MGILIIDIYRLRLHAVHFLLDTSELNSVVDNSIPYNKKKGMAMHNIPKNAKRTLF